MQSRLIILAAFLSIGLALSSVSFVHAQAEIDSPVDLLDLTQLSDSSTATLLRLTDDQRVKLAELMQRQVEAMATEDEAARTQALSAILAEAKQLLTDQQLEAYRSLPGKAPLTFNFREQKWIDVLDWFARQAGLSLVVNEPPPGAFTYSDTKSYTPIEALDLLNGVLTTRGFTLIRRDRMLVCADISKGIPTGLIPRVRLDDLDQYGNFELIQVMFPLGAKPAQGVSDEIQPLLGQFGTATVLSQTKQILVNTTAGKMRAISAVIASIPEPQPAPQPKPEVAPPPPELAIYPVKSIDPQVAVETLSAMFTEARFTYDQKAGQINAFATPGVQAAIKKLLDQMAEQATSDRQRSLEIYPLNHPDPDQLLAQVKLVVPDATFSIGADPIRLIAFADQGEHQQVTDTLAKMKAGADEPSDRMAAVYELKHVEMASVTAAVNSLFPRIDVVADADTRRLIVVGTLAEQAAIKQLLDRVDASEGQQRQLRAYELNRTVAAQVDTVLKPLVPEAQITRDAEANRLIVIASESDHVTIQRIIKQLTDSVTPPPTKRLQVYPLTEQQRRQFTTTYRSLAADLESITVNEDQPSGSLHILATEQQHERIGQLVADIQRQLPHASRQLRAYELSDALANSFRSLRGQLAPELSAVQITDRTDGGGVIVVATEEEHAAIAKLLKDLEAALPDESAQVRVLAVTPAQRKRFLALLPSLQSELGSLRIVDESKTDELTVWATDRQASQAKRILETLKQSQSSPANQLVAYPLKHVQPEGVVTILQELHPDTRIVSDVPNRRILVWTDVDEHQQIEQAMQQLDAPSTGGIRKMAYYKLGEIKADEVLDLFQQLLPEMSLVADDRTNSIIAWGSAQDHQTLSKTVQEVRTQGGTDDPRSVISYPCGARDVMDVQRLIGELVPTARLVADPENRALVAWASSDDHQTIREAISRMTRADDGADGQLRVYTVTRIDASDLLPILKTTVPTAQLTASADEQQVLVWTTTADHQKIETAIRQIEAGQGMKPDGFVRIYRAHPDVTQKIRDLASEIDLNIRILSGGPSGQLSVWASESEHKEFTELIDDLKKQLEEAPLQFASHPLGNLTTAEARRYISAAIPDVQFLDSSDASRLLIRARPEDHVLIKATLNELQEVKGDEQPLQLRVYSLGDNDPDQITGLLDRSLTEGLSLIKDANRKKLIVRTTETRHEALRAAIDELVTELPATPKKASRVYRFKTADPASVQASLGELIPQASFAIDQATGSLIATALPDDHQLIEQVVQQLDAPEDSVRRTAVYRFKRADLSGASELLKQLMPKAIVAVDDASRALLITASESEHQRIDEIVQQLDESDEAARNSRVYRFRFADVTAAKTALEALLPDAIIAADSTSRALVATASDDDHRQIADTVEQLDVEREDPNVTRVYPFRFGEVTAAQQVLAALLPNASIAVDPDNRILVATATVEEHKKIDATVQQMDSKNDRQLTLQAYAIHNADAESIFETLNSMYDNSARVSISLDQENNAILAKAPAEEHVTISQIVARMDNARSTNGQRTLKVYMTQGATDESLVETIRSLVDGQRQQVDLTFNEESRQLIAVASDRQHELIRAAIDQMRREEVIVEVFPLQAADPFAVQNAIEQLYEDELNPPLANGDVETQQLFVRGTKAQLEDIRKLLVKMGEVPTDGQTQKGLRVIPFRGDIEDALRQLEEVWPKLRRNKLEVIRLQIPPQVEQPAVEAPADAQPSQKDEQDDSSDNRDARHELKPDTHLIAAVDPVAGEGGESRSASSDQPTIIMVPGSGSITIMSQDEEALDQAQALLATLARQTMGDSTAGNFVVFLLRNAGAQTVAKLLDDLFKKMPLTTRVTLGKVSIVADQRLNALVVHGRPADRRVIAELIKVLDSTSVPDSLANARPQIVALEYADADRVMEILEGVYEAPLQSGGNRPEVSIPEGISSDVASVLEQINAAASGPLLTLKVDDVTNSIVILAPRQLAQEVEDLIRQLDRQALENDSRDIGIISLKSTNVSQIEEALNRILESGK